MKELLDKLWIHCWTEAIKEECPLLSAGFTQTAGEAAKLQAEILLEYSRFTGDLIKMHGGWIHKFSPQIKENLRTEEQVLEQFLKQKGII